MNPFDDDPRPWDGQDAAGDLIASLETSMGLDTQKRINFWADRLASLSGRLSDTKWERGDALNQARVELGEDWAQLFDVDRLPVRESKLRQEMWVAGRFPVQAAQRGGRERVVGVDWSVHRLVCTEEIPALEAMALLRRAKDGRWGYQAMERAVKEYLGGEEGGDSEPTVPDPTKSERKAYVDAVVARRCPDVPAPTRKTVLTAALAAVDEWDGANR